MEEAPFQRDAVASEEGAPTSTLSPQQLWRAVRKSWWMVLGLAGLAVAAAFFFTLGQPKIYESTSTVSFEPNAARPLGRQVEQLVDTSADYWNRKEYYNTQYWVLTSPEILEEVVRQLGLDRNRGFVMRKNADERSAEPLLPVTKAAELLKTRLTVAPVPDSRLAKVTCQDVNPERAARVLRAVVETYVSKNQESLMESTDSAAAWLRSQVGTLKKELEDSEIALHDYKKNRNILSVSMDDQSNMLREQLKQFNEALAQAEISRAHIAARRNELAKVREDDPSELPAGELFDSPLLQALRTEYVASKRDLASLTGEGKGANHPQVLATQARIATTRDALLVEVRNIKAALDKSYASLSTEVGNLNGLVERAKGQGLDLNMLEIEFKRLERSRDTNERLYSLVTDRAKESDLARMFHVNNVRIVGHADIAERPISPNMPLNLLTGGAIGLLLGLFAAVGRELLDRSIKSAAELESWVRAPFLGMLPSLPAPQETGPRSGRRRVAGRRSAENDLSALAVHKNPTSGIAEAARAIRTNVVFSSPDKPYQLLLVTSAAAAEGKTTVVGSLATAMAQAGQRVLIVDCDLRRPRQHQVFGASNREGLTTALLDLPSLDRLIVETEVPNVSLLPSGPLPPNPAELLHSESFDRLLTALRSRYDRIILDSPPIAPVTDAVVLSNKVDGTILVVRAFKTTKDLAARARRSLRDVGAHVVGTVLNDLAHSRTGYGYSSYYGYQSYKSDVAPAESESA